MSEESFESVDPLGSPTSLIIDRAFEFAEPEETIEFTMAPTTETAAPTGPKLGGVNGTTAWIGGPPKSDWSGTTLLMPATPYCYRSDDPASQMKAYGRRTDGLETKFKRDDAEYPLLSFSNDALAHMETHGMDTLFYMDATRDLFRYHALFTIDQVQAFCDECLGKSVAEPVGVGQVDHLMMEALRDAGTWLLNSLDESVKASIRHLLPPRPLGPVVWMAIVAEVEMESLQRVTNMVKKFEAMKVSDFKGENVSDYCLAAGTLLVQLEREGKLPETHLSTIVNTFSNVSVQKFSIMWMAKHREVDLFVRKTTGKDKKVVEKMPGRIHFNDLLGCAKADFNNLQAEWGPAQHLKPDKIKTMQAKIDSLNAKLSKVDQKLTAVSGDDKGSDKNDGKKNGKQGGGKRCCHRCGSPDHFVKDCDKPAPSAPTGKWAPPKDGEPHTKKIDGRTKKWCSKCRGGSSRWTGHLTEQHRSHPNNNNNNSGSGSGSETTSANVAELELASLAALGDRFDQDTWAS